MDREEIICNCMEITHGEIVDAIKSHRLQTVVEIGDATEAGTVCGSCQDDIALILKTVNV
ncbi:MAG: (2Fe-2S)-binding protein [Bacteroidales bacterium]|nr:(2Fe-2S)-binding protein [Bacteroidales bacterium]